MSAYLAECRALQFAVFCVVKGELLLIVVLYLFADVCWCYVFSECNVVFDEYCQTSTFVLYPILSDCREACVVGVLDVTVSFVSYIVMMSAL